MVLGMPHSLLFVCLFVFHFNSNQDCFPVLLNGMLSERATPEEVTEASQVCAEGE